MIRKLIYILKHRYNPYPTYWFDLLTERHLKNRQGECVDCVECCRYLCGCLCEHVNKETKRCNIYENRTCYEWFPISQKDIDYRASIQPGFKCKLSFKQINKENGKDQKRSS